MNSRPGCCVFSKLEYLRCVRPIPVNRWSLSETSEALPPGNLSNVLTAFYRMLSPSEAEASLLYTTDPAMASKTQKAMPVQGGFLLVEPNMVVFDRLCDVVRKVCKCMSVIVLYVVTFKGMFGTHSTPNHQVVR